MFKKSSNECRHSFSSLFFVFQVCTHTCRHAHTLSIHTVAHSHRRNAAVWNGYHISQVCISQGVSDVPQLFLQICVSCPELKRPVNSWARFPCLRARPDPAQALLRLVSEVCNLILDPSVRDTDLHHQRGRRARCLTLTKSVHCRRKMNSRVQPPPSREAGISASGFFTLIRVPGDPARGSSGAPVCIENTQQNLVSVYLLRGGLQDSGTEGLWGEWESQGMASPLLCFCRKARLVAEVKQTNVWTQTGSGRSVGTWWARQEQE